MNRFVGIGAAARSLGVSMATLRRWEAAGKLVPDRTAGGHRRYDLARLRPAQFRPTEAAGRRTVGYARVAPSARLGDLERQKLVLEQYCARQGWTCTMIAESGSGMNDSRPGLRQLLVALIDGSVDRLVVTRRDRLLRFGAELVFAVCEAKNVEVVVLNQGEESSFDDDVVGDVAELVAVGAARLYGDRSRRSRELIEAIHRAVEAARAH